ncbi:hypothetical protein LCGC14_1158350, partial [marine sediment metagenome]
MAKLTKWYLEKNSNKDDGFSAARTVNVSIAVFFVLTFFLGIAFFFYKNIPTKSFVLQGNTPVSEVYKTGDKTSSAKLFPQTKRYKDSKGKWASIDTSLKTKGSSITTGALPYKVTFSKDITKSLSFEIDGETISFTPVIARSLMTKQSQATLVKNKATYTDIYKNTNLERIITPQGLKQNYVLTAPGHPTSFTEKINTNLSVKLKADGSLIYYEGSAAKATKVIATSPKPHLTDAKGKVVEFSYALLRDKLTISLPSLKGLSYPITVDPSIYSTADYGTGVDGDATISTTVDIKSLYEDDDVNGVVTWRGVNKGLNKGVGAYDPSADPPAVPNYDNLTILSGGELTTTVLVSLEFKVKSILSVNLGGKIDASGKGYLGGNGGFGQGPGRGAYTGGAGYGGNGASGSISGSGIYDSAGITYGEYPAEPTFGSGGGSWMVCGVAGNGGGAIKIQSTAIQNFGEILADGEQSVSGCAGAGSGGGIYIVSQNFFDLDKIYARGGPKPSGDGGGGGGGRITISAPWMTGFPSVVSLGNGETGTVKLLMDDIDEPALANINQFKSDEASVVLIDGGTDKRNIFFKVDNLSGLPDSANIKAHFEVKQIGQAFDDSGVYDGKEGFYYGNVANAGESSSVLVDSLKLVSTSAKYPWSKPNYQQYHWRVRLVDDKSRTSEWVYFGNNNDTPADSDFYIDKAPEKPGRPQTKNPTNNLRPTWTWSKVNDLGRADVKGYYFYLGKSENSSDVISGEFTSSESFALKNPLKEGIYYARIKAVDTLDNQSEFSDTSQVLITQDELYLLITPTGLNVTAQGSPNRAIDLNLIEPIFGSYDYFNIYRSDAKVTDANLSNAKLIGISFVPSFTDLDVTAGQTYFYQVTAVDDLGQESSVSTSVFSDSATVAGSAGTPGSGNDNEAPTIPGAPVTRTPTTINTPTWRWNRSTDSGSGVKGYKIFIGTAPGTSDVVNGDFTDTNAYTHQNSLSYGRTYYSRVLAVDNANNESASSSNGEVRLIFIEPNLTAPNALNISIAKSFGKDVEVNWQTSLFGGVDHYNIYRYGEKITNANKAIAGLIGTSYSTSFTDVDQSKTEQTRYYYQVTSVDKYGTESPVSVSAINDYITLSKPLSAAVWTSRADWEGTNPADEATSISNLDTQSASGDVELKKFSTGSTDIGTGVDDDYTLSTNKTIKDIYEIDLGYGAGSYDPSTGAVPNFNDLTISGTGVLTTTSLVSIEFKVSGTVTIYKNGKIDAGGKGYTGGDMYAIANGSGPGGGTTGTGGGGGGYGGDGGIGGPVGPSRGAGGVAYGAYPESVTFGSGAAASVYQTGSKGGKGGGSIAIQANRLLNNGTILADGYASTDPIYYVAGGGGGAGGGIYIASLNKVNASGIYARGGNGMGQNWGGGGGGGGRVAIKAPSIV